jgi:asparagine synthase (glutamine-hydrolysing)
MAQAMASGALRGQANATTRRLAKMFSYAGEEQDRRLVSYFFWSTDRVRRGLYAPEFAREVESEDAALPLLESLKLIPDEHDPLQRLLFLETRHFLADHNLNYTDRAGMAAGVEVRVPLLDLDLVEFATRVPASMKQRGKVGKPLFKSAMEAWLPRDVIYRPKSGFGVPLRRWLRTELLLLGGLALVSIVFRTWSDRPRAPPRLRVLRHAGHLSLGRAGRGHGRGIRGARGT